MLRKMLHFAGPEFPPKPYSYIYIYIYILPGRATDVQPPTLALGRCKWLTPLWCVRTARLDEHVLVSIFVLGRCKRLTPPWYVRA